MPRHPWGFLLTRMPQCAFSAADLHNLYSTLAVSHGADENDAALFADCLLDADLRNHQTQGIGLLPYMDELFGAGIARFGAAFRHPARQPGRPPLLMAMRDRGMSYLPAPWISPSKRPAMQASAFVTTRNSGDCGMVASYALRAASEGMIGIAMSTGRSS